MTNQKSGFRPLLAAAAVILILALAAIKTLFVGAMNELINAKEKFLGVRPIFTWLDPGFIQDVNRVPTIDRYWKAAGLRAIGISYWTIGSPAGTYASTRFDPDSPYYQAWFGCYMASFDYPQESSFDDTKNRSSPNMNKFETTKDVPPGPNEISTLQRLRSRQELFGIKPSGAPELGTLLHLALADQVAWLRHFKDPAPEAVLLEGTWNLTPIKLDGRPSWCATGNMLSHSDVGNTPALQLFMTTSLFTRPAQVIGIKESFLFPREIQWKNKVSPYHDIFLRGYYIIVPLPEYHVTACIFGCTAAFSFIDGKFVDYYNQLDKQLWRMAQSIRFISVNSAVAPVQVSNH